MKETRNPFSAPAGSTPNAQQPSSKLAWGVAAAATIVALVFSMLWLEAINNQTLESRSLRTKLAAATADLAKSISECKATQNEVTALKQKIMDLLQEKEMAGQMAKSLEDEMRSELESKDVTISRLQGKLTVTIVDRVMFDSGEAILKPAGAAVMQKIAGLLATHPNLKIHVVGHTDNVPMRSQSRFASNWELSAARALAAVHYLTERAGVDPRRVGAVGYGEFRPIADNSTPEGRAKNRRIAISILSDELAGADTLPATEPVPAPDPSPPSSPQKL